MNQNPNLPNSFRTGPDERGHFGIFGGRFVAETLMPLILDLEKAYAAAKADPAFRPRWTAISSTMSAGRRRSISPSA
jgi:tryptophan synthase beta subunit